MTNKFNIYITVSLSHLPYLSTHFKKSAFFAYHQYFALFINYNNSKLQQNNM